MDIHTDTNVLAGTPGHPFCLPLAMTHARRAVSPFLGAGVPTSRPKLLFSLTPAQFVQRKARANGAENRCPPLESGEEEERERVLRQEKKRSDYKADTENLGRLNNLFN